ncbi:MAG: hypothetical protein ACM3NF_12220, partial [Gemmatimonadota bacterium]
RDGARKALRADGGSHERRPHVQARRALMPLRVFHWVAVGATRMPYAHGQRGTARVEAGG